MSSSISAVSNNSALPLRLKDEAYLKLEHMIVTGDLEPGMWVSETELITLTGLSRASVRSAVERLAEQQLITVTPRRGAQICPIDFRLQFRALELRRVVERLLVASACSRANDAQRQWFSDLSMRFDDAAIRQDQQLMTQVDLETFSLVLEAADNPFATKAMTSVKGLSRRFWVVYQEEYGDTSTMATLYSKVTSAIAAGSSENSMAAVDELIDYVEAFTMRVVGYCR